MTKTSQAIYYRIMVIAIVMVLVLAIAALCFDSVRTALVLRAGHKERRVQVKNELYETMMVEKNFKKYPVWTYSCLVSSRDPYDRIYGGKYLYYAASNRREGVCSVMNETSNVDWEVRSCALTELHDVDNTYSHAIVPVLENAIRVDPVHGVRQMAFVTLVTRSRNDDVDASNAVARLLHDEEWAGYFERRYGLRRAYTND